MRKQKVTQGRVIRSEWIKFWSLRSSVYSLLGTIVVIVGIAALAASQYDPGDGPGFPLDGTTLGLAGGGLAQLILGVLGVLVISGEYSTGMIRATMSAVPRRLPVLWAKVIVYLLVVTTLMLLTLTGAFLLAQFLLDPSLRDSLTEAEVQRRVVGTALYLSGVGVIGIALGAIFRSTAGAISVLIAALLVIPGIVQLALPERWKEVIYPYLPGSAGDSFTGSEAASTFRDLLDAETGAIVFASYLVVLLLLAAIRLRRSDV